MKTHSVNELREMFLSYFESKEHLRMPSFSLIPQNDNSLLLINSGMAPLKPFFTGQEKPPRKRVTTCQKCIRTGDIDNIGHTARHGTFFEMLGNFSFGDYFKKESLQFSWEFLTEVVGLDKDRLYPSVYLDDDEAFDIWNKIIGIPKERIFKFGKEDNFWEHGSGPCGPCSEIYYDRGEKYGCGKSTCTVGCDCDRYMEVWNNVFSQFNNDGKGNYTDLIQKNIDTGMGLERLAVVVQDAESIFEVDTSRDLMNAIAEITKHHYKENGIDDISLRIIADHIKSCTFMIGDGILPSNEGRGYVLRRLLRRAVRHAKKLGVNNSFMSKLSEVVIQLNSTHYTELQDRKDMIQKVLDAEEDKFLSTLDQGLNVLNGYISDLKKNNINKLSGDNAFKLYDTFGFPLDITKDILDENNITIDIDKFNELMQNQKETARNARKTTNYMGADATIFNELPADMVSEFVGYDKLDIDSNILSIAKGDKFVDSISEGDEAVIICDKTTMYATMGGQEGDKGIITTQNGQFEVSITEKILNTKIGHFGKMINGEINKSDKVHITVDKQNRHKTAINHTATHLLQAALREVLGKHVEQAGSLVTADRLRFDFTHFNALTKDEIDKVEKLVNQKIDENLAVAKKEMSLVDAKKAGATALFGEKYGETVRTVKVSDFSFELCGGTHIDNTKEIKYFKIVAEESVAQGVRRIEAVTYDKVIDYYKNLNDKLSSIEQILKTDDNQVVEKVEQLILENKKLLKTNEFLKKEISNKESEDISAENINGINLIAKVVADKSMDELKDLSDTLKDKFDNYLIVLGSSVGNKPFVVVQSSDYCVSKGILAKDVIKKVSEGIGGKGGGKEKFAQAGGTDATNLKKSIDEVKELL